MPDTKNALPQSNAALREQLKQQEEQFKRQREHSHKPLRQERPIDAYFRYLQALIRCNMPLSEERYVVYTINPLERTYELAVDHPALGKYRHTYGSRDHKRI